MKAKSSFNKQVFIVLVLLLQNFFISSRVFAIAASENIQIPAQFGSIKESFNTELSKDSKQLIINIQDAHCNYEAQKNLAQILEYLIKKHNLKLILVEGGSGDVNLGFLRSFADPKAREEVADKYLKEGKISGEEYLDIVSDYEMDLYGVEDEELYDAHMDAFWKVDAIKEKGVRYLNYVSNIIKNLKPSIYNAELKQLDEKKKTYNDKALSLSNYCQYLKDMALKKRIDFNNYTQLSSFTQTAKLETETDFKQAEIERNAFIKELAGLLDENGVKELLKQSQDFKAQKITSKDYYLYLKSLAAQKIDIARKYPALYGYISYLTINKDINTAGLLKEIDAIEMKVQDAYFTNDEQRKLSEISRSVEILAKCFNLELTPEDYSYFQANKSKFPSASWINFLTEASLKYSLNMKTTASSTIDDNLGLLENFYKIGKDREDAFIRNAFSKMKEDGQNLAVLITGGFHTNGITRMLKDKQYPFMVVTPVVTQKGDSSIYFSVLKGEKRPTD